MPIISLKSENVKRIKAIEIIPDGNMVVIGGNNGQGKSSTLDSIAYALGGKSLMPSKPIREGEDHAKVVVELEDLIVTRTWTNKGSHLAVTNKDGAKYPSPQTMLDNLFGGISFDPLQFNRMKPADQAIALRKLVGIDTSLEDAQRSKAYTDRAVKNSEARRLVSRLPDFPKHPDAPEQEVSVAALMEELKEANAANKVVDDAVKKGGEINNKIADLTRARDGQIQTINDLKNDLKEAVCSLEKQDEALKQVIEHARIQAGKRSKLEKTDTDPIQLQITNAESVNTKVRANKTRAVTVASLDKAKQESEDLSNTIKKIDTAKMNQLANANYPIDGLAINVDGQVTMNDIPLDQASAAEQLRVSVAIGLAMNPKLPIVLIRDGSLLDDNSLALIANMAQENNAQVWLERVGNGKEVSVLIEDGSVVEN